jgi:hypothetical protein
MISRRSSGSSRADRGVEPTRSQNITVTCRRSASLRRGGGAVAGCGAAISSIGLPQPPQNLASLSFAKPQAEQGDGKAAPHRAQKRLVAAFSAMQLEQRIYSLGPRDVVVKYISGTIAEKANTISP